MNQSHVLALEVEDLVLDTFVGDHSSLATCALVSRRWLHESRRRLFTTRKVLLTPSPSTKKGKLLHELLGANFQASGSDCTFWPHIRKMTISGKQLDPDEDDPLSQMLSQMKFFNLALRCISRSSHLRRLRIIYFDFSPDFRDELISRVASTINTLSSLQLRDVKFASPKKLIEFLGAFRNLDSEVELQSVQFLDDCWNEDSPRQLTSNPSLQWKIYLITADHTLVMLKIIVHNQWNITTLRLEEEPQSMDELYLLSEVVQQSGNALQHLYFEMGPFCQPDEPNPISLSRNESLRTVGLGILLVYPSKKPIPSVFLTTLLQSIQSQEQFQGFQLCIDYVSLDGFLDWECIECFDWEPVEDILMDEKRFPGNDATFLATFGNSVDETEPGVLLKERCLPRLTNAERLQIEFNSHLVSRGTSI